MRYRRVYIRRKDSLFFSDKISQKLMAINPKGKPSTPTDQLERTCEHDNKINKLKPKSITSCTGFGVLRRV